MSKLEMTFKPSHVTMRITCKQSDVFYYFEAVNEASVASMSRVFPPASEMLSLHICAVSARLRQSFWTRSESCWAFPCDANSCQEVRCCTSANMLCHCALDDST
jgi:hypothetical protein